VQSAEIKKLIDQFDSKRRGAVSDSIRHTVEATDALTRATLLVAYGQLRTAEAVERVLEAIQEHEHESEDLSQTRVTIPK